MILRILRGRAQLADVGQVMDAVRSNMDDWSRGDAGLVWTQVATRELEDGLEFLLVSTWTDVAAVEAQGGDVTRPRGRLGRSGVLRDARARHYELVLGESRDTGVGGRVVRLSTVALTANRSSIFYEQVRHLWDELVGDAGLVAVYVGRGFEGDVEQAVICSVWESRAALEAATSGGFVGGEAMGVFYASEPLIEHFETRSLERADALPA